jgi:hypothetical protein
MDDGRRPEDRYLKQYICVLAAAATSFAACGANILQLESYHGINVFKMASPRGRAVFVAVFALRRHCLMLRIGWCFLLYTARRSDAALYARMRRTSPRCFTLRLKQKATRKKPLHFTVAQALLIVLFCQRRIQFGLFCPSLSGWGDVIMMNILRYCRACCCRRLYARVPDYVARENAVTMYFNGRK